MDCPCCRYSDTQCFLFQNHMQYRVYLCFYLSALLPFLLFLPLLLECFLMPTFSGKTLLLLLPSLFTSCISYLIVKSIIIHPIAFPIKKLIAHWLDLVFSQCIFSIMKTLICVSFLFIHFIFFTPLSLLTNTLSIGIYHCFSIFSHL